MSEAVGFVNTNIETNSKFIQLCVRKYTTSRGNVGNTGGTELLFCDRHSVAYLENVKDGVVYSPGLRNAKQNSFLVGNGDNGFLDFSLNSEKVIINLIDQYFYTDVINEGKQTKNKKTQTDLLKIVKRDSRTVFEPNSVLVPRAIRTAGRIYLTDRYTYIHKFCCL